MTTGFAIFLACFAITLIIVIACAAMNHGDDDDFSDWPGGYR